MITKSIAQKYFGSNENGAQWNAIGKTIIYNAKHPLNVTGIVEDYPNNTDLPLNLIISWASFKAFEQRDFTNWEDIVGDAMHFLLLRKGTDPAKLERKFPEFDKKYKGDIVAAKFTEVLQPLKEMHYDERFGNLNGRTVSKETLRSLILIGVFILLIACIKFVNIATAQAVKRSREIGVRKVIGATRSALVRQFLFETCLLCAIATVLSIGLCYLLLPPLTSLLQLKLNFESFKNPNLLLFLIGFIAVVSLMAGLYPSLILSGYKPILALKNKIVVPGTQRFTLLRGLIVLQFVIAQVLIIGTLVVPGQLDYFKSKPLGFDKTAIINIYFPPESKPESLQPLRNSLERIAGVRSVSFAPFAPSTRMLGGPPLNTNTGPRQTRIIIPRKYL